MITIPRYPKRLTLITILYGMFTFVWLSAEDSIWLVSLLGLILALLLVVHGIYRLQGRRLSPRLWIPGLVTSGAVTGAGAALCTALIMIMKTSLHGHLYPDYPFPLIAGIIARLPVWTLAGALVGMALALLIYRRGPPEPS